MTHDLKTGDVVHVRCKVQDHGTGYCYVSGSDWSASVAPSDIVKIEPRIELQAGDKVVDRHGSRRGSIVALHEDRAWVSYGWGDWRIHAAVDLERVAP